MTVHLVVPAGIDDASRPSGGNVYDRRLRMGLEELGWTVHEHRVAGAWPRPRPGDVRGLRRLLAGLPSGATVLVDGLIGTASEAPVVEATRLRLVVLVHMPLADALPDPRAGAVEGAVLGCARAVVTTSRWAREWLLDRHPLEPARVHVAVPGVDRGPRVSGSADGGRLLCVGAVTPDKGHDVLLRALAEVREEEWRCVCAGALDIDPGFVGALRTMAGRHGIERRVHFAGPVVPARLEALRSATDLVVSASRRESYGMAVAEGLARGIPVVATDAGGHPEAVGVTADGSRPGLLVPTDDVDALAGALRRWLTDPDSRARLRAAAACRRTGLPGWEDTARAVSEVLCRVRRAGPLNRSAGAPVCLSDGHRTER